MSPTDEKCDGGLVISRRHHVRAFPVSIDLDRFSRLRLKGLACSDVTPVVHEPLPRSGGGYMPSQLFFTNIPHDCSELELKEWIESCGIHITSIRIIRDMVSGASPAFAYATTRSAVDIDEAISALHGKRMRNQIILVSRGSRCVGAQAL